MIKKFLHDRKVKKHLKKTGTVNYYVVIGENDEENYEQDVLFNGTYKMKKAVALKNINNQIPISYWSFSDFVVDDEELGLKIVDDSAALRYASSCKFKFIPT